MSWKSTTLYKPRVQELIRGRGRHRDSKSSWLYVVRAGEPRRMVSAGQQVELTLPWLCVLRAGD